MPVIENAQCLCPDCLQAEIVARQETQSADRLEPKAADD
jgi:hypothetical protein